MQTTVIITASVTRAGQTLTPGVQLNVPDTVAQQWIDAGQAMAADSAQALPADTPPAPKRKTKG
jgi:hypothetical protein